MVQEAAAERSLAAWKPPAQLKRLQFVGSYGQHYSEVLSELLTGTHKVVPKSLQPSVAALEARLAAASSPLLHAVQDRSSRLLRQIDCKVRLCSAPACWRAACYCLLRL